MAPRPPGEALRRQARELIDGLPALELPSAIAFLEFLGFKGNKATGPVSSVAATPLVRSSSPAPDDDDVDLDDEEIQRANVAKPDLSRRAAELFRQAKLSS